MLNIVFTLVIGAISFAQPALAAPVAWWCHDSIPGKETNTKLFLYGSEAEGLQCRVDLFTHARSEILLDYYIFRNDRVGAPLMQLLVEAARERSIKVRIILDENGKDVTREMQAYMESNGIEFRRFRSAPRYTPHRITHRLHDKMIVVDSEWLLTGGRNFSEYYFGMSTEYNFLDLDALIYSRATATEARDYFYHLWQSPVLTEAIPPGKISKKELIVLNDNLKKQTEQLLATNAVSFEPDRFLDTSYASLPAPVHFIHEHFTHFVKGQWVETSHKNHGLTDSLINLLDQAKFSVQIENPYFVPTNTMMAALERCIQRGVRVTVLTNSEYSNDLPIRVANYRHLRKDILEKGIDLWEFQGARKLHAKTLVIDDRIAIIGSYNFHSLSECNNTEVFIWTASESSATALCQIINLHMEQALPLAPGEKTIQLPGVLYRQPGWRTKFLVWFYLRTVAKRHPKCNKI